MIWVSSESTSPAGYFQAHQWCTWYQYIILREGTYIGQDSLASQWQKLISNWLKQKRQKLLYIRTTAQEGKATWSQGPNGSPFSLLIAFSSLLGGCSSFHEMKSWLPGTLECVPTSSSKKKSPIRWILDPYFPIPRLITAVRSWNTVTGPTRSRVWVPRNSSLY